MCIFELRMKDIFILYIDPGTGSLLLQIVAGGAIASVVFFKKIWYSIFSVFKRKEDGDNDEE
jgi:hypothetical protein